MTLTLACLQILLLVANIGPSPSLVQPMAPIAMASQDTGSTSQFRGDLTRSGVQPGPGPVGTPAIAWKFPTNNTILSSPTVVDGVAYFGSNDSRVHAVDVRTGDKRWDYATEDIVESSPAVADGIVYVGSNDNTVYALDSLRGQEVWRRPTAGPIRSSPAIAGGTVYVGSGDSYLYALDQGTGQVQWVSPASAAVSASPALADGLVYFGDEDGNILAVSASNGDLQWRVEPGGGVTSALAVVDGIVYVGTTSGNVFALLAHNGAVQWRTSIGGPVRSSPAVVDGMVFIGGDASRIVALHAESGGEVWTFNTGGYIRSSPAVVDGVVYVGSDDQIVYAIDAFTGTEQWRFKTGGAVRSSPSVTGSRLYVGSDDGYLYAIKGSPSAAATPSPVPTVAASPSPAPSNTPRLESVIAVEAPSVDGSLDHKEDDFIEDHDSDIVARDFVAEATFINPYDTALGSWDYGFIFRSAGANEGYRLIFDSSQQWKLGVTQDNLELSTINSGAVSFLKTGSHDANRIQLIVTGDQALVYVNANFVDFLDVSGISDSSYIKIATGIISGNEINGMSTDYQDFSVKNLDETSIGAGTLEVDDDSVSAAYANVDISSCVVTAQFVNPQVPEDDSWSYGLFFRDTGANNEYRVYFHSSGAWFLELWEGSSSDVITLESGVLENVLLSDGEANELTIFVLNDYGMFAVNGETFAVLDLSVRGLSGDVAITAGLANRDHLDNPSDYQVAYSDFSIWSLD